MNVLITGANGFLGSWLTKALIEEGHHVKALVRKNSDLSELKGISCEFVYGDVTDKISIEKNLYGIEQVYHLAGVVAYKAADRPLMDRVNVGGTENLIEAISKSNIEKLIHVSSVVAVGGSLDSNSILDENSKYDISHLNLGYFETKHQAEILVKNATHEKRIQSVILNPSTIYGFGDAKKGSRKMQVKVARGELPFYPPGGVNVVAVEDVISGIISASKIGRNGERYILANENLLIRTVFEIIANAAGVPAPRYKLSNFVLHTLGNLGEISQSMGLPNFFSKENAYTSTMFHWFDSSKAKNELGFTPRPAKIAIENSVRWMQENGYLK